MVNRIEGEKIIGIKQTLKVLKANKGQKVYIAKDADNAIVKPLVNLAETKSLEVIYVDSMKQLGKLCGIDVGASAVTILKD